MAAPAWQPNTDNQRAVPARPPAHSAPCSAQHIRAAEPGHHATSPWHAPAAAPRHANPHAGPACERAGLGGWQARLSRCRPPEVRVGKAGDEVGGRHVALAAGPHRGVPLVPGRQRGAAEWLLPAVVRAIVPGEVLRRRGVSTARRAGQRGLGRPGGAEHTRGRFSYAGQAALQSGWATPAGGGRP